MAFARGGGEGMEAGGIRKKYTLLLSITSLVIFGNRKKITEVGAAEEGVEIGKWKAHTP